MPISLYFLFFIYTECHRGDKEDQRELSAPTCVISRKIIIFSPADHADLPGFISCHGL